MVVAYRCGKKVVGSTNKIHMGGSSGTVGEWYTNNVVCSNTDSDEMHSFQKYNNSI